jgi:hypothetical protein
MDRALLVGINEYPGAPLCGCVNDVTDMAALLTAKCGVAAESIRLVTDARADTAAITERLAWLVDGLRPGDRALFHYSGHGAQAAARDANGDVGPVHDVICPVDFDWSDEHMITDDQFHALFAQVPAGVECVWISDSCHSGGLDRAMPRNAVRKSLLAPVDIAWRALAAAAKQLAPLSFVHAVNAQNVALLAACASDETAADASFQGRPNGALTYYLLQTLNGPRGLAQSLTSVVSAARNALAKAKYPQEPQLAGSLEIMRRPFFAAK